MGTGDKTYPGGLQAMLAHFNKRRDPFVFYKESLPDAGIDLAPLTQRTVTEAATTRQPHEPVKNSTWARKRREIAREFVGNSELAYLNAQLIANLRRETWPEGADTLFQRLWAEQSAHLIDRLSLRWQVSSLITFADAGQTAAQREAGQGFRMLFGLMKLYEFERLHARVTPEEPFSFKRKKRAPLPLDMEYFALKAGGLDIALLAPLWELGRSDPVMAPLADHLMTELNADPGTLFRRLHAMRAEWHADKAGD